MVEKLFVSERRACVVIGQCRSSQRYQERKLPDENRLQQRIIELAREYGRYGYRRIKAMLWQEGWVVNHKRVERIWREEGLEVPAKQPKKSRLWLNDGSCIRLRPEYTNHVWWLPSASIALTIRLTKRGKPENYLIHWLRYQIKPGKLLAFPDASHDLVPPKFKERKSA